MSFINLLLFIALVILILFILFLKRIASNAEKANSVGKKIRSFWNKVSLGWTLLVHGWHDESKLAGK